MPSIAILYDLVLTFISNNTEPEKSPKSPKTDRELVVLLLDHDAEHNEEDKLSAAVYCAVCTFCAMKVTGCAVKGLESLLVYCKDKFTLVMEKLFAKYDISIESIEKHCIKICLGIQFENQLENLVQRIENRQLHREICSTINNIDLKKNGGGRFTLVIEHLSVCLQTVNGQPIAKTNYKFIMASEGNKGTTFGKAASF